jgi:hypothetical protein
MSTFPQPSGLCIHGRRLKLDPCESCTETLTLAELRDKASRERIQGPYRSDGMPWVKTGFQQAVNPLAWAHR